jgi:peptide/nickel transport system permease protein
VDGLARLLAVFGAAVPTFWAGLIMQIIFYGILHVLPAGGRLDVLMTPPPKITGMFLLDSLITGYWKTLADALLHLIMPALTLGLSFVAVVTRITRSSMLEVLNSDFVKTARAKGLPESVVVWRHALRNALLPSLTVIGMQLGWMMGGTVLIETVFSWGGLGFWAVAAVRQNDFPVIMAITMVISLTFMIANLLVDILYVILDPRIKYS